MVDNISKPFTFVANTYAKASEVNADFDALYTGANACINQVNTNITSINTLDSNKANKNGSSQEVFKVKNPENDLDAVNRQSMMKAMGNSIDYISGFIITKDQTSPNDTIVVSPGSCYDDTRKILLSTTTSITKQNENQGASTTYYVYATSVNSTGIPTDITISQSSVSPGTTLFRKIGSFTTDSNGNIDNITSSSLEGILNTGARVVTKSYNSGYSWYRVYSDGWCEQGGRVAQSSDNMYINLVKSYINTNYTIMLTPAYPNTVQTGLYSAAVNRPSDLATYRFRINWANSTSGAYTYWETKGYIS